MTRTVVAPRRGPSSRSIRRALITVLAGAGAAAVTWAPAQAQSYAGSVGWSVGAVTTTALNDGAEAELQLEPGLAPSLALYADRWWGRGLVGTRVQFSGATQEMDWQQGPRDIAVYTADLSLLLRLGAPSPGRSLLPYVGAGIGGVWWLLGNGATTTFPDAGAAYSGEESFKLAVVGSAGIDFVTPLRWDTDPVVVRLEARDAVQLRSPLEPLGTDAEDFGMIHNIRLSIGFHTGIGRLGN
ncbi:MAG: hypothetical protein PVI57_19920 [Gemmatimonadota bacterium]|jgi:hypothetical protein